MRTGIPDPLREIVEHDAYLMRLQTSLSLRTNYLDRHNMATAATVTRSLRSRIVEMRDAYFSQITMVALDVPIVYSATGVKYIGTLTFLRLAIHIDIGKADNPASLWRYCGLGVTGGYADTVATTIWPGMVTYNEKARRAIGNIRAGLMKKNSAYRPLYNAHRQYQTARGVPHVRAHLRASRYMVKVWLKHLWLVWRRQAGLPLGVAHPDDATQLTAPYGWR